MSFIVGPQRLLSFICAVFGLPSAIFCLVLSAFRVGGVLLSAFLAGFSDTFWFCGAPAFRRRRSVWAWVRVASSGAAQQGAAPDRPQFGRFSRVVTLSQTWSQFGGRRVSLVVGPQRLTDAIGGDFGPRSAAVCVVFAVFRVGGVLLSAYLAGCGAAFWV